MNDMKSKYNERFNQAKRNRQDEYYTLYKDVEDELQHHTSYFQNKTVYCNADDPSKSNFVQYFIDQFHALKLKRLYATCYEPSSLFPGATSSPAVMLDYDGTTSSISKMKGDGDFRGDESIAVLEQSDVVVTNPPFSLFIEYLPLLVNYDKKFLIIGPQFAFTYKAIFKLLLDQKWKPARRLSGGLQFTSSYQPATPAPAATPGMIRVNGIAWFTNLPVPVPAPLELTKKYNPVDYPRYDNYEAVNVDRVKDIPRDYHGVMGVPLTFLYSWNPAQFDVIGSTNNVNFDAGTYRPEGSIGHKKRRAALVHGKSKFHRILIRRRNHE